MLVLFHDKKCWNFIYLFPCILWDFTILGLVLSWWRIKPTMRSVQFRDYLARSSQVKISTKRPHEKHMLEAEESSVRLYFMSTLWDRPSHEVLEKLSAWKILSVTFLPFTHTICTLIIHKSKWQVENVLTPCDEFTN